MIRFSTILLILLNISTVFAQNTDSAIKADIDYNFGFEKVSEGRNMPDGWSGSANTNGYTMKVDTAVKHSGKRSLLIQKTDPNNTAKYAMTMYSVPAKFEGKEIELRAFMKYESVSDFVNLIFRIDDEDHDVLEFASLEQDKFNGSHEWREYIIKLSLPENASSILIWPMLSGSGKLWVDDVRLLIDGKELSSAKIKPNYNPNPAKSIPYGNNESAGGRVKVKDAEIYYETYGEGKPLLLLHGNSQSISVFKKQIKEFSKSYKVIAVDSRGQGKSTDLSTGPFSYDLFADDMKTLLDSLHILNANILGWSDGGNTGLIMAYKYPLYVNRLAVMGANTEPTEQAVSGSILKEVRQAIEQLKTRTDNKALTQIRLFNMLLNEPHITAENLHNIKASVLVMAGEKDMILEKHTKYIADRIPKSRLFIFKGATHYAPVEVVNEFNELVMDFFNKI